MGSLNFFLHLVIISFSLVSAIITCYADTIHLTGTVVNELNQAVAGAEVFLYKRDFLSTHTSANGRFELAGNPSTTSAFYKSGNPKEITIKGNLLSIYLESASNIDIFIYDCKGRRIDYIQNITSTSGKYSTKLPVSGLPSGVYFTVIIHNGNKSVIRHVITTNSIFSVQIYSYGEDKQKKSFISKQPQIAGFNDILVVSAQGTQTVRRAITAPVEENLIIKLMPSGVGYITPGIPVFRDNGGTGDVTTYGSPNDPEFSQGGACNYGSTGIRYYAAINVNQIPGDLAGQWQGGQICGACARVRIRTTDGEIRTTVVRIMDKCADENCGIDLGGAPAGEIMKNQPGRYSGEWEWVSCEEAEGVSDGPPSLHVKAGSNQFWSLVQARNGPGAVDEIRVRKTENSEWISLPWATEAENYFKLPVELLQDNEEWEIEVLWKTGSTAFLRLSGSKLAIENSVYQFSQ